MLLGAVSSAIRAETVVVTDPRWMEVASALRGVDQVLSWDDRAAVLAWSTGARVVDLQGSRRSEALLAQVGGGRRWSKGSGARIRRLLRLGPGRGAVVERYARACGVQPSPRPWIGHGSLGEALAIVPGAAWAMKRWQPDGFIEVGRGFRGPVFVLGSAQEEALLVEIASQIPGATAVPERGFTQTLRILPRCCVAVGGDTGLMHLASACGLRTVTLMGPTHPDDGFVQGRAFATDLWCRPCALHGRHRCPLGHHRCMKTIEARGVLRAVLSEARR